MPPLPFSRRPTARGGALREHIYCDTFPAAFSTRQHRLGYDFAVLKTRCANRDRRLIVLYSDQYATWPWCRGRSSRQPTAVGPANSASGQMNLMLVVQTMTASASIH
jgi:hypothetical protein